MGEIWKAVPRFPEYQVSSLGRVRRSVPDIQGKNCGKIIKGWIANSGYRQVRIRRGGIYYSLLVNRLVCHAFHGEPPTPKHHASHRDGNKTNNRKGNVRWLSASENNMERHKHGTMLTGDRHPTRYMPSCVPRGSGHGNAKLNERQVSKIRKDKRANTKIALDYGVSPSLIGKVKKRIFWTHVA